MDFREFVDNMEKEAKSDIEKTLKKLPKKHRKLVAGFSFKFQPGNTMHGDKDHVGLIDTDKKEITIAAPWNYSREFCLLHEIAHLIWKVFVSKKLRKEWSKIVKNTKHKMKDGEEELFAFAYSDRYAKHKDVIHHHPEWEAFVKRLE